MNEPITEITDGGQVFFTSPEVMKLLPPAEQKREDRHMSRSEAITILMRLSAERTRTVEEVTALQMGALRLLTRSFRRERNWARRRAAEAQNAAKAPEVPNEPTSEPTAETAPHEPVPENADK